MDGDDGNDVIDSANRCGMQGEVWNSNVTRYLTEVTIQMAAMTSRIVDQGSLIPLLKICK